ncbi:ProQ/FINO family protein [Methylocystis sp.]|uniref:ProQ/FINO family protein n=1 Tax=Methylocystis sp. TaxID=1911079 RepID=UPI0025E09511|nr:ProQ/FINO family protein [Methylocystis sp.]
MTAFDNNQTSVPCGRGAAEQTQAAGAAEGAERPGYAAVRALLDELVAAFPACFKPHRAPDISPIKLDIHADVLARRPDTDPVLLTSALRVYASGPDYWRTLIAGRPRIDLDGQIVQAVITPEEKAEAERRLACFDLNQKAKKKGFRDIATLLDKLAGDFPGCFKSKGVVPHPVKIGIHADILARQPDIDPVLLHAALRLYVRSAAYQSGVIAGRPRVDLDGQVVQTVFTPRETAHAQEFLSTRAASVAARRASAAKLLDRLAAAFPACFKRAGAPAVAPLKHRVDVDLRARLPDVDIGLLNYVLDRYRTRPDYCRAVLAGRAPVDLDGNPVDEILTAAQIANARERLAAIERRDRAHDTPTVSAPQTRPATMPRAEKKTAAPGSAARAPGENRRGPGGQPERATVAVKDAPAPLRVQPKKAKPRQPEASHAPSAPKPLPEAPRPATAPTPDLPAAPPPQERARYPLSKRQQTLMGIFSGKPPSRSSANSPPLAHPPGARPAGAPASAPRSGKGR